MIVVGARDKGIGRRHYGDRYMEPRSRVQSDLATVSKNRLQDVICVTRIPVFRAFDEGAGRRGAQAKALWRLGLRVMGS